MRQQRVLARKKKDSLDQVEHGGIKSEADQDDLFADLREVKKQSSVVGMGGVNFFDSERQAEMKHQLD